MLSSAVSSEKCKIFADKSRPVALRGMRSPKTIGISHLIMPVEFHLFLTLTFRWYVGDISIDNALKIRSEILVPSLKVKLS